jgi:imidazolonepropionase-like amidohydrolase
MIDKGEMSIPPATGDRRVWLRVGNILTGTDTRPLRDAHIVYDRREILHVGGPPPASAVNPGRVRPDLELPDHTLLPGLIEAHAHFFLEGGELDVAKRAAWLKQTPECLLRAALLRLQKLLRLGVIAVRDAGDKDNVGLALSRLYRNVDRPLMPYVDSPGAAIHHRGRYGSFMGEPLEDFDSPDACVAARIKLGADRIKLIPTGIINFQQGKVTTEPQMTAEEVAALVQAAKARGRQTFAHASGDTGIDRVIYGGADSVEHGFFVRPDQLARMRDQDIAWVPTFAPVRAQVSHAGIVGWDATAVANMKKILDQHAASLAKAHEMGVTIIAGSDAGSHGVPHGIGFLTELELMEKAGLPADAVINAATGKSWRRLAFPEEFGQIKKGFASRFILTEFSPLQGVANLAKPKTVIYDGAPLEPLDVAEATGL